ncbi:lipoprotein [Haliea sp.]|uniref:LPS translocon maturation chaperone LptM n=1 Tax=Haliea sp. TaxID=1932666 RepID=UPI0025BEE9A0|nr:lipoprotein [Haliea sp.]
MPMTRPHWLIAPLLALLAGCGQTGPLQLPPQAEAPATAPVASAVLPATTAHASATY